MSLDFKVDPALGDMVISPAGAVLEATGIAEVRQRIKIRVQKQLGEWRYNLASGVPWMTTDTQAGILGSKNAEQTARGIIAGVVENTVDVSGINSMTMAFDTTNRVFNVSMEVATIYGIVTLSL